VRVEHVRLLTTVLCPPKNYHELISLTGAVLDYRDELERWIREVFELSEVPHSEQ